MSVIKPGWKTSEFYITLVSFIFSGLYLLGVIGETAYKDELIRDVSHAVESVILISGQLLIIYNYIQSRKKAKSIPENSPNKEPSNESKPNKPRTSTKRNRKTDKNN